MIEDTARIIERPASFRDIEIAMDLDPELPKAWVDADLIKQVIMNMLVNAQHAIEHEGSITVRSRRCAQSRSSEPGMAPVAMVEIAIIDTGCGIPEKNLKRIFDPFFTSKEVGKGTGLGLSVSHGIVKAHGGSDRRGKHGGQRFHLPHLSAGGPARRICAKQQEQLMKARILVVDDEEIVIRSCLRILGDDGDYEVDAVQDGMEALRKIDENHYDALILDIMMPKMDGLEVLRRVKETHPDIDVIMVTGLSQIETAVRSMKLGAFDYLPKPFDPDELKLVVKRALERRQLMQENLELRSEVEFQIPLREHHRLQPADAERLPPDREMRAHQQHGDAHG